MKVIHIDCDCFYAAVEIRDNPRLRGRPVAVGGDPNRRGVVATCNYPAREFGVHSAMASSRALQLCPELIILPPDFDKYRRVSEQIHTIFRRFTDRIEPLSLDEAYLDVTDSPLHGNSATRIAEAIRRAVHERVRITVSAGVAPNKFLAKVASDWRKPDGLFTIAPSQVAAFVEALPVRRILGVGRVTGEKMTALGVHTCGDLQRMDHLTLVQQFGSFGERLYHLARGQDDRPVRTSRRRKSVSVERTYHQDRQTLVQWQGEVDDLLDKLTQRIARLDADYLIQGLSVKVRYSDFRIVSADQAGTRLDRETFLLLFEQLWHKHPAPARLLGLGVRLRDLQSPQQPDLFPRERELALHRQRQL